MALHPIGTKVETKNLKVVRMWVDDLEEVVEHIRRAVPTESLTIEVDGEYRIDDVSDLLTQPNVHLRSFSVRSQSVELRLGSYPSQIKVTGLQGRSLANAIDAVANRCLRLRFLHRTLHSIWYATLVTVACAALIIYGIIELVPSGADPLLFRVILPTSAVVAAVLAVVALRPLSSVLCARRWQDAPPFWHRKRDDLIIASVSLVLGGIIGYCVNIITR